MDFLVSAVVLAWVAIIILTLAMAGLLRQVRLLSTPRPTNAHFGPARRSKAPTLRPDNDPSFGHDTVILFLDAGCDSCDRRLALADDLATRPAADVRFVAVFRAGRAEGVHGDNVALIEHGAALFDEYAVPLTPLGVAITKDRVVVQTAPLGSDAALHGLVAAMIQERLATT
jgi:hypothetical protein